MFLPFRLIPQVGNASRQREPGFASPATDTMSMTYAAATSEMHSMVGRSGDASSGVGGLERVAALLGLVLFLPLMLVIAGCVLAGTPGPLFVRTYRASPGGRLVRPLAFRTHRLFDPQVFDGRGGETSTFTGRLLISFGIVRLPALADVAAGRIPLSALVDA